MTLSSARDFIERETRKRGPARPTLTILPRNRLWAGRSGYNSLESQSRQLRDVARSVEAIVRLEHFILHLGKAEADHLSSTVRVRHLRIAVWRQEKCKHLVQARTPRVDLLFYRTVPRQVSARLWFAV